MNQGICGSSHPPLTGPTFLGNPSCPERTRAGPVLNGGFLNHSKMFQSSLLTQHCWALVLGSKTLNSSGGKPPPGSTMHTMCSPMGAHLPLLRHPGKPRGKHNMHLHSFQGCLRALLAGCPFGMGTSVQT